VNYQATDKILTYFTFSQGFKSGGWTTRATTPILVAPTFNPEKANTYEIGLKGQFSDRLLQANIAGFYTDYSDLQVTVYSGVWSTAARARTPGATCWGSPHEALIGLCTSSAR